MSPAIYSAAIPGAEQMAVMQTVVDQLSLYAVHLQPFANDQAIQAGIGDIPDEQGAHQTIAIPGKDQY